MLQRRRRTGRTHTLHNSQAASDSAESELTAAVAACRFFLQAVAPAAATHALATTSVSRLCFMSLVRAHIHATGNASVHTHTMSLNIVTPYTRWCDTLDVWMSGNSLSDPRWCFILSEGILSLHILSRHSYESWSPQYTMVTHLCTPSIFVRGIVCGCAWHVALNEHLRIVPAPCIYWSHVCTCTYIHAGIDTHRHTPATRHFF